MKNRGFTILIAVLCLFGTYFYDENINEDYSKDLSSFVMPIDNGKHFEVLNDNVPEFDIEDMSKDSFELYSSLDEYGRAGTAYAKIGFDLMPTESRESISSVTPSGWINKEYDVVSGGYLYNRSHLIGFQLTGQNANEKNLITGTRSFNVLGMLPFENLVADYILETNNSVMYRVIPIYDGDNLLASGVIMEGYSVEDDGDGISFNVFVYNKEEFIVIDYSDGSSYLE